MWPHPVSLQSTIDNPYHSARKSFSPHETEQFGLWIKDPANQAIARRGSGVTRADRIRQVAQALSSRILWQVGDKLGDYRRDYPQAAKPDASPGWGLAADDLNENN